LSTFLDALRIFAAFAVFLGHTNFQWFFGNSSIGPNNGQDYVIIFFVLSGFVIAWSIDKKKTLSFKQYLFDRLTRLWSVIIPALFFGYILDYFGRLLNPSTYNSIFAFNHTGIKFLASSFFLQESWFYSIRPGSNGPFWSISYEFFYYLIFGSIMLLPGIKKRILGGIIFTVLAGPKVLLLFPCWLIGALSYFLCKNCRIKLLTALLLIIPSGYFLFDRMLERWVQWNPWEIPGLGLYPLFYSAKFLDDYLTALAIAIFIVGGSYWFRLESKPKGHFASLTKHFAGSSFSLYAIHFPLLAFIGALGSSGNLNSISIESAIFFILATCYLFARLFEFPLNKYRALILYYIPTLEKKCGIRS
jgi:peptidoglycan/LPS O-acetylase OafA/YrhL